MALTGVRSYTGPAPTNPMVMGGGINTPAVSPESIGPQLQAILERYGLTDLIGWASEAIIQGKSDDQIMLELYDQPTFQQRFAGIFSREAAGLPPMSVDEYLQYETIASSLGSTFGMNLTKAEIDQLISNDVSVQELEERFNIAATAVYESDAETRGELERLFNINQEQLMRFWMDPKAELGRLQQQYRMGEIAGAALRTGFGQITGTQAGRLQEAGLTQEQALSGFGQLASMSELFSPLDAGENNISQDQQIDVLTGDANAAQTIERRQARRKAEFEGTGGFASGQSGFSTGEAE